MDLVLNFELRVNFLINKQKIADLNP
jgi:hypothetical protein